MEKLKEEEELLIAERRQMRQRGWPSWRLLGLAAGWLSLGASDALVGPPAPRPVAERARVAWAKRANLACLQEAIDLWEVELRNAPEPAHALALARAHYHAGSVWVAVGQGALGLSDVRGLAGLQAGGGPTQAAVDHFYAGERAANLAQHPPTEAPPLAPAELAAATLWEAANLMQYAWGRGLHTAYLLHPAISAQLQRSLQLGADQHHGLAHALLGAHLCRLPPELGGSLEAAAQHFAQAKATAPAFLESSLLYAGDLLPRTQQATRFAEVLQEAMQQPADALLGLAAEQRLEQRRAAALLRQQPIFFW
jgi:hypothetical protein